MFGFKRKPKPPFDWASYDRITGQQRIANWERMKREGEAYRITTEAAKRTPPCQS